MQKIPIPLIEPYEQLRLGSNFDIDDITNSLHVHGQLSPICVRENSTVKGKYQIIFGNRRFAAAKKLGWPSILAEVVDLSDDEALIVALSENLDRRDLSDYEKALVLNSIYEGSGKSLAEIAEAIGKSSAFVAQHIAMLHLFPDTVGSSEEREKVLCNLTEKHARALSRIEDPKSRWDTAKLAIAANLSSREIEKMAKRAPSSVGASREGRETIIRELVLKIVSSLNSKNVKSFFEVTCPEYFTMFGPDPPFSELNFDQSTEYILSELRKISGLELHIQDIKVKVHGDFAYVTLFLTHQISLSGRNLKTKTRATIILEKMTSSWKVVHEHWSTIFPLTLPVVPGMKPTTPLIKEKISSFNRRI